MLFGPQIMQLVLGRLAKWGGADHGQNLLARPDIVPRNSFIYNKATEMVPAIWASVECHDGRGHPQGHEEYQAYCLKAHLTMFTRNGILETNRKFTDSWRPSRIANECLNAGVLSFIKGVTHTCDLVEYLDFLQVNQDYTYKHCTCMPGQSWAYYSPQNRQGLQLHLCQRAP